MYGKWTAEPFKNAFQDTLLSSPIYRLSTYHGLGPRQAFCCRVNTVHLALMVTSLPLVNFSVTD